LLVRPLIRQEAVSTSALEGTQTDFDELLGAEANDDAKTADAQEVLNYVHAVEHCLAQINDPRGLPVSRRMLDDAHGLLLRGVRGDSYGVGQLRSSQVWIGRRNGRIADADFVPPPPGDPLNAALDDWERWIHDDQIPLLVRVALGHYQFETIHPYTDGNGRLGRLVAILQLIEEGLLAHHSMTISGWFERDKRTYIDLLQRTRETGDFDAFVAYFVTGLEESAISSLSRVRRAGDLVEALVAQVRAAKARGLAVQITEDLLGYPVLTVPLVESRYDVSYPTANAAVARLVEIGILTQLSDGNYNRVFGAPRMLGIFR
jgi:Fic family protein